MRFFGRGDDAAQATRQNDEQALARYRYMLATAPPEEIEAAHAEAFAKLSPEQRRQALQALAQHVPQSEVRGDDPQSLARAATRAEVREPGTIERVFGGPTGASIGLGSWFLYTLAGSFIGTAIAQSFFDNDPAAAAAADADPDSGDGGEASGGEGWGEEATDGGDIADGGDFGGDVGGGDFGGDLGGF